MPDPLIDIVRKQHDAFNASGWFLGESTHPDVEWVAAREDPDAATHQGAEEIQRYFDSWTETIEALRIEGVEYESAGDRVFTWIRLSGKGKGSGADVEMEQAQVWTFRDGKAARIEEYFDRTEGLDAAGLKG